MADPGSPDELATAELQRQRRHSPSAPGGGAPHLTRGFLFADLRDYTSYVDAHGDHAAAELLGRYRALVRGAVAASDGAEIKTEGDSFYVVFDSASAAVRAGQEIIAAADAAPGEPIRVGVGVHAGETVETAEGFVGSAVNIAARLCAQAKAGELVVSDTVRALTRTYLDVTFEPLGARRLKGVNEQIVIYRVVPHATTIPGRARLTRDRRLPRLVVLGAGALLVVAAAAIALVGGSGLWPTAASSARPSGAPASAARTSAGASASAGPGDLSAAEQALKARIPLAFQRYCIPSSPSEGSLGGFVSFQCILPPGQPGYGADTVWYDRFDGAGAMTSAVTAVQSRQKLAEGTCGPATTGVIGAWSIGITLDGVLACYTRDGGAWILWTYKGDNIAVRAVRRDGDMKALYAWWKDVAAPFLRQG